MLSHPPLTNYPNPSYESLACFGGLATLRNVVIVCVCAMSLSSISHAEEADEVETVEPGAIDLFHLKASQRLSDFIGQIDEFFGGEEESARVNESWARIRLDTRYDEVEGTEFKGNVKLKLVLPNAKKRFRLLLSTDENDIRSTNTEANATTTDSDSDVSLALRFIRKARDNGGVKLDLGARFRQGKGQAFFRLGAFSRFPVGNIWTGTVTNNAFYYSSAGFEDKLTFKFERAFGRNKNIIFQSSNLFAWREGQKGAELEQVAGLYRAFKSGSTLAFEVSSNSVTSPATGQKRFRGGALRLRYRRSVWRSWLYLEFWPSVRWPVEQGYKGIYGGLLRVEALIGQHDS